MKANVDSCGTVTWNVTGSLTNPSTGTFSLSATNPNPSCQGIPHPPVASANETVALSAADCLSGNGTHTISPDSFATHWQDPAPASPPIPTSLSLKLGPRNYYNGGRAVDCNGTLIVSPAFGWVYCAEYTLLDQMKKPILNTTTYIADEVVRVVYGTYTAKVDTASVAVSKDGKFRDELRLIRDQSIPAGTKAVWKQVISIRNTANGAVYQVRVNCMVRTATNLQVNDITTSGDQSCSGF